MKFIAFLSVAALLVAQPTTPAISGKVSLESTPVSKSLYGSRVPVFKGNVVIKNTGMQTVQVGGADVDLGLSTLPTIPSGDANALINRAYQNSGAQRWTNGITSAVGGIGLLASGVGNPVLSAATLGKILFGMVFG